MSESVEDIPFVVRTEPCGDHVRVLISGELDLHREAELHSAWEAVISSAETPQRLVLDVSGLRFLDSSGMRALLVCRDRAHAIGVPFLLAVTPGPVTRLLRIAGVQDWFDYA